MGWQVVKRKSGDKSYAVVIFETAEGVKNTLQGHVSIYLPLGEAQLYVVPFNESQAERSTGNMELMRNESEIDASKRLDVKETVKRWLLIANSIEQRDSWLVVLHWLADGCPEPAPHHSHDSRIFAAGIAPRTLTSFEWTTLKSDIGLLDLPFSAFRPFLHLLQERQILDVNRAYDREYVLYATFQMELHAFQTGESDIRQRYESLCGTSCVHLALPQVLDRQVHSPGGVVYTQPPNLVTCA
jgi:hypothetical protein